MKFKKTLMPVLILLVILTIGAVSAADDAGILAVDDVGDDGISEAPDDVDLAQANESDGDLADAGEEVVAAEENDEDIDEVIATGEDVPDFNFKVKKTEVDVNKKSAEMFYFDWSDVAIWGNNHMCFVLYSDKNITVTNFYQDQTGDNVTVKLRDLQTWGPGTYNYTVTYLDFFDNPGILVGSGSFIITSKDVPVDFITINEKVIKNKNGIVATIYDPVQSLHGTVKIYAKIDGGNVLVYSKSFNVARNKLVTIYAKNLSKLYDGAYKIDLQYARNTGAKFSKSGIVQFSGVYGGRPTSIKCNGKTITYKDNKKVTAILKDNNNNPVSDKVIVVKFGTKSVKLYTNNDGQVSYSLSSLAPGKYTFSFTFAGTKLYKKSAMSTKVTVNKASVKLTASKKTYKKAVKVKKYKVKLRSNLNKPIKKAKLTLKVNKKLFKAKTNSKGVAVFKMKNFNDKGNFNVVVRFGGNKYYNAGTLKQKITVK